MARKVYKVCHILRIGYRSLHIAKSNLETLRYIDRMGKLAFRK